MLITIVTALAALFSLFASSHPHRNPFSWPQTKHIVAFGDSYTYIQGTHGRQNYSFIGDAQNYAFTPNTLLSNLIVQNQTSTAEGGPNWLEYLTNCGLKSGLTNPRTCERQLWDFAFAGADIEESSLTPLHHNFTVPFVWQVEQFITYGEPVLNLEKEETLVVVWIGINDINDTAEQEENFDFPALYRYLMNVMVEALGRVAELGYKKLLVLDLPPLDRTPGNVVKGVGERLPSREMVGWWGEALREGTGEFEERKGAEVMVFGANELLNGVMDRHDEYGIKDITGYCPSYDQPFIDTDPGMYGCLPLDEYFWFNTGHMTSHDHEILAHAVEDFLVRQ